MQIQIRKPKTMKDIKAIVYRSNAGHTKAYAQMLSEQTGIKAYDLRDAGSKLEKNAPIIYMGWLMAGQVKGYKAAFSNFEIKAVCGVGMAPDGTQVEDIKKTNPIPIDCKVFSLQGGFDMEKLSGTYKQMMKTMRFFAGNSLKKKANRTADEDEMLDLLYNGGDKVSLESLKPVIEWLSE